MDKLEDYLVNQSEQLVDNPSLLRREIAYERLKDALQHADLEPGQVLSETRLSKLLGTSRTPVREALHQLAQEGLVQVIPGRAVTVAAPTARSVMNVVHLRYILEPELARLAAETISQVQIDTLEECVQQMEEACDSGDQTAWSKADTHFHEVIASACPNELLGDIVVMLRNRAHHLASIDSQTNPVRLAACTLEHREIVDAIAQRDSDAAVETTRNHIDKLRESLFNRMVYG